MIPLLVILMTVVVSRSYINMNLQQESKKNAALIDAIVRQIDRTITESIEAVQGIMIDDRITAYVRHQFPTDADLIHARMACRDYLRTEINRHSAIYGLLFMRPDGSLFGVLPYANVFKDARDEVALSDQIIDQVLSVPLGQTAWIGPVSGAELYGFTNSKQPDSLLLATWKAVSAVAGEYHVLMLMDDVSVMEMLNIPLNADSTIHIFSAEGQEYCRMGEESGLDQQTLLSSANDGRIFKNDRGESYCIFSISQDTAGWVLVREVSMEDTLRSIRRIQRLVWMMVGIALIVALVIYLFWLRHFMRSFNALKSDIIRLGQGKLEPAGDAPMSIEEFESMRHELNRASLSLNRHMETVRRMEREKLELEMNDLHSILAPHMIFNSITAIRWMATFMGAEAVSDMLVELGEVIRPVLREWRVQWTIREELEHVSHYAKLMDLRFANNFRLECQVDSSLDEELIPQFTLQPLIENAGQHGGHSEGPLVTTVRAMDEGDWIRLTVADNGNTIRPEKIAEIRENLRTGQRNHGVGLVNVYSRLVLCKGEDSTLDIEALPEGGTMVTLRWRRETEAGG
ncbi:MAG: histidine kinase [Eubacteriales bacterium]|nr:histidine kinase [Eubacteriales bacterium]